MKIFKFSADGAEQKCPGCGWLVYNLYTMANTQVEADRRHKEDDIALCGDCLCDVMTMGGHEVHGSQVD